jgi:hypothetical protein
MLTGRQPQEEVHDTYTRLDLFVCRGGGSADRTRRSSSHWKPAGTPGLASIGGRRADHRRPNRAAVQGGEPGVAEQAIRLAMDPELRQGLVAGARRFVESERTRDRIVPGYLPVYRGM